ncbi:MAG: hypothetical protein COS47_01555 [Candidatus Nealsonbacteria bacterium CG03_land_8_20_14_0_80_36_12]|uniref:Uncharacterized protein n=1 Tax=Candidatus Nealsonbacteria bacterium CG03_land_8_20_14_0_80_36_12 TaxID=1974701 RepID=A0A2M7BY71_9BACT|nr:MAG: hypothetical protein COS47_01555 [Candidatus Nealsonbacteria bacterium CG03_land_8_20_14_0_80_36_12]
MNLLKKIQNLSLTARKIIFWLVIIGLSLGLFSFWVKNFQKKVKTFEKEEFQGQLNLPSLGEELKQFEQIKENFEELKKLLEQNEEEPTTTETTE